MLATGVAASLVPITDPVLTFAVVMGVILVAPLVMRRLRIPGTIGLILAGVVIGPNALGVLELNPIGSTSEAGPALPESLPEEGEARSPQDEAASKADADAPAGDATAPAVSAASAAAASPEAAEPTTPMDLLGTVGLLYILFLAGLQLDLNQFRRYRNHSLLFGSVSFLLPQLVGTAVAKWLLGLDWLAAVLLGSMFGSHTLLTYPIATRLGLVRQRAVTTGVGGTIVTDVSALVVLTVVAGLAGGSQEGAVPAWAMALTIPAFVAAVGVGLPRLGQWFLRTIPSEGSTHFVFILTVVYLAAFAAEAAGLQPIIGAFLAGLALNRLVPRQSVLMNRLEFAGSWLLIPSFLVATGMRVDPKAFVSGVDALLFAVAMAGTVAATKFAAAWACGKSLGYRRIERWVLFSLSVNQAAATLAAVMVGFRIGIFTDPAILNGTVAMIMVSCGLGTAAMERWGRRLALEEEALPQEAALRPQRILIPLGNPRAAESILDIAFLIRDERSHEPLHPLTVVQESIDDAAADSRSDRLLEIAVTHAVSANVPVAPSRRLDTNAASGILRAMRELRITTVVMGWTGSSAARHLIFGTVLDELLRQSPQQFVVCRTAAGLGTLHRLVLLVPPFAHREPGFADAIRTVKLLAAHANLEIVVSARAADLPRLEAFIAAAKPEATLRFEAAESIARWAEAGGPSLASDDLVVLLAARRSQVSWTPMLDRLPQALVARAPETSLVVLYPSEEAGEAEAAAEQEFDEPLDRLFSPRGLAANATGGSLRDAIDAMFSQVARPGSAEGEAWHGLAARLAAAEPLPLAPGVVLLNAVTPLVRRAEAMLATAAPIRRSGHPSEIRVVVALLEPPGAPATEHLRHLSTIARSLHDEAVIARLLAAASAADLAEALPAAVPLVAERRA